MLSPDECVQEKRKPYKLGKVIFSQDDDLTRPQLFEAEWVGNSVDGVVKTHDTVVVKRVTIAHGTTEIDALQLLMSNRNPHPEFFPHVITTRNIENGSRVEIVMQYGGIDLFHYFFDRYDLWLELETNTRINRTTHTLAKAMCCLVKLHSLGMYHGDVKPENFVIDPMTKNVQMIDFECAKQVTRLNRPNKVTMPVCTWIYAHPHICSGVPVDGFEADMWSFGQMAFVLYVGRSLFDIACETERMLRQHSFYYHNTWYQIYERLIPEHLFKHPTFSMFIDFVNVMCSEHHSKRPLRAEMMLLQHPFLCSWRTNF